MSGSDYHDFVQLGAEGQSTPTAVTTPGVLQNAQLPAVAAQASTQSNPQAGIVNLVEQVATVAGPNYYSPGKVGGP